MAFPKRSFHCLVHALWSAHELQKSTVCRNAVYFKSNLMKKELEPQARFFDRVIMVRQGTPVGEEKENLSHQCCLYQGLRADRCAALYVSSYGTQTGSDPSTKPRGSRRKRPPACTCLPFSWPVWVTYEDTYRYRVVTPHCAQTLAMARYWWWPRYWKT